MYAVTGTHTQEIIVTKFFKQKKLVNKLPIQIFEPLFENEIIMNIRRGREILGDFVTSSTTPQNTEEERAMGSQR